MYIWSYIAERWLEINGSCEAIVKRAFVQLTDKNQKKGWFQFLETSFTVLVAGAGFEPTTFGLWAQRATGLLHPAIILLNF